MQEEKEVSTDEAVVEQDSDDSTEESASDDTQNAENDPLYWKNKYHKERRLREETSSSTPVDAGDDVVKKSDLVRANEDALKRELAASSDPADQELVSNWSDIAGFYVNRSGAITKEQKLEDMRDAQAVWKLKQKPGASKPEADIAQVHGTGGKSPTDTPPARKSILPKRRDISEWY